MKFQFESGDIIASKCDAIVVNLFEGIKLTSGATGVVDKALGNAISGLIKSGEFKGKLNETHVIHTLDKMPARLAVIVGLGKKSKFNPACVRNAMGETVRVLRLHGCKSAATILHGAGEGGIDAGESAQMIAEGFILGGYQFRRHLTKKEDQKEFEELIILDRGTSSLGKITKGLERGKIVGDAVNLARDMVNEPANYMTPSHMAEIAAKVAEKNGLEITVWGTEKMKKEKMGALLGVARGSKEPPRLIMLKYHGDKTGKKTIGIVGKGLTFDSGGISLKAQEHMSDMKGDMAGGAAVIAAIGAIAGLGLKINVTAIVPATENLPGGRALKPGDVLKVSNGKTVEVVNTDAEGRLILADALSYAVKQGISPIIDLATLTGACQVALGDLYAGVFTNDQNVADKVIKAAKEAGELLWQLPLAEDYKELNKSDIADIKNSAGRYGGAITAALFLQEFIGKTPWVHLDIAAPFLSDKTKGALVKGATGFGVRTLVNVALSLSK